MKKIFAIGLMVLVSLFMIMQDASAGRFGGGRSFGVSRSASSYASSSRSMGAAPQNSSYNSPNRWLAPLAGFAMGGLLTSLFMGHGFGGGGVMLLLLGAGMMILFALLRRFTQQNAQPAGASAPYQMYQQNAQQSSVHNDTHYSPNANQAASVPQGFDANDFLRKAKVLFIRMQAAYDQKNLDDLNQFTTPDVFAEVKMQLQERGDHPNQTDVVQLNAELLDANSQYRETTASVRFSGLIKEDRDTPAIAIDETWHFRQPADRDVWQVAGVQQN